MGSSLTIRKNTDGSYEVYLGIYKFTSVDNTAESYDPQMNILHISGTADIGGTLAADITADGTGRLIVTLTESPVSTGYLAAGAVFTFWPRVTGYSEYDEVLANICDLRLAGTHGTETDFSSDLLTANDYYQTPGWLLRDLDGDGIPELLLGANWDAGHAVIFNIYRSGGTRAVCVVNGWNRNRWYLCTDGSLANEGSSSAFESSYSYYRYTSGELQHLETLLYLDDGSGGSPCATPSQRISMSTVVTFTLSPSRSNCRDGQIHPRNAGLYAICGMRIDSVDCGARLQLASPSGYYSL